MRCASCLRWPWLVIGSVPPEDSITMSDQIIPVEMCTEATWLMPILSSLLPNMRGLIRLTCWALTTICVGKNRLPLVQRLAAEGSSAGMVGIKSSISAKPSAAKSRDHTWQLSQRLTAAPPKISGDITSGGIIGGGIIEIISGDIEL